MVPEDQAAVAARIIGIILDDLAFADDGLDFGRRDHRRGARHLPDRVWCVEDATSRRASHLLTNVGHRRLLTSSGRQRRTDSRLGNIEFQSLPRATPRSLS